MTEKLKPEAARAALEKLDAMLDKMIEHQRAKVLRLAREAVPNISPEDVRNPNDYLELKAHPTFDYEDGILAGMIATQIAIRTELKSVFMPPERP